MEVKLAVSKPAEKIRQSAYVCYENQKLGIIRTLFKDNKLKRVIIFSGSKQKVKEVQQSLVRAKINSGEMHSDLDQAQRDEIMYRFKSGQIDVLVATDIVARGIDIDDIQMVINYDVPRDAEDYVHRIGRTARADRDGEAITFISEREIGYFQQIEHFLEKEVEKTPIPGNLGDGPKYEAQPKKFGEHHSHGKGNKGNGRNKSRNRGNNNRNKSENTVSGENRTQNNNGNREKNRNHRTDNKNQNHTSIRKTSEKRENTATTTNKVVE